MSGRTDTTDSVENTESDDRMEVTRPDEADRPTYPDRGGIDVFSPLLVRQPIRDGKTPAVRDLLVEWIEGTNDGDARTLLPVTGVTLVTLFLDDGDFGWDATGDGTGSGKRDALIWYVEVADGNLDRWKTPDRTIRSRSPLFEAGLDEYLAADAVAYADNRDGHRLVTHASLPDRQERYADAVGPTLVAPVAGEDLSIPVALTTIPLKAGPTSRIVARGADFGNWLKRFDAVQSWVRDRTDVLEEEAMYTESLLLESIGDRQVLHYYMETEGMARLYDAYGTSDTWEVRFSDWVMRRIFEDPGQVVEPPLETDCAVLIHAVDPERP